MATAVLAPIVLDERGIAYIEGTTTRVTDVILNVQSSSDTPEELQPSMPHLTLGQIDAALSYYHQNKEALDAEIQSGLELAARLRQEAGESPFAKQMRAEDKLV
jgi:uncharacterized protein (DUF433 family)